MRVTIFRTSFALIVMILLTGCANSSTQTSVLTETVLANPTIVSVTESPSTEKTPLNTTSPDHYTIQEYTVPAGSHPHDVAPAPDGTVWYTAQALGELGRLDPKTGETHQIS